MSSVFLSYLLSGTQHLRHISSNQSIIPLIHQPTSLLAASPLDARHNTGRTGKPISVHVGGIKDCPNINCTISAPHIYYDLREHLDVPSNIPELFIHPFYPTTQYQGTRPIAYRAHKPGFRVYDGKECHIHGLGVVVLLEINPVPVEFEPYEVFICVSVRSNAAVATVAFRREWCYHPEPYVSGGAPGVERVRRLAKRLLYCIKDTLKIGRGLWKTVQ